MQLLKIVGVAIVTLLVVTFVMTLTAVASASPVDDDELDEAPRYARIDMPHISAVLEAAYRAAGLDRNVGRGFVRRARLAGLVPWLSVRTARDTAWKEIEPEIGRSTTLEVRATWRLDRLMFEPRELQVASLEGARRRERRRLAKQVIRAYFVWREAQETVKAEEAAAELDALTDGWFSKAVEIHGATSETRTRARRLPEPQPATRKMP